jgi:hypothetical protein
VKHKKWFKTMTFDSVSSGNCRGIAERENPKPGAGVNHLKKLVPVQAFYSNLVPNPLISPQKLLAGTVQPHLLAKSQRSSAAVHRGV